MQFGLWVGRWGLKTSPVGAYEIRRLQGLSAEEKAAELRVLAEEITEYERELVRMLFPGIIREASNAIRGRVLRPGSNRNAQYHVIARHKIPGTKSTNIEEVPSPYDELIAEFKRVGYRVSLTIDDLGDETAGACIVLEW